MDFVITTSSGTVDIKTVRSRRKSMGLQIMADGSVLARVPYWVTNTQVKSFLREHTDWIVKKSSERKKICDRNQKIGAPPYGDLTAAKRRRVRDLIAGRVDHYCEKMGVSVGRIAVRNQKTRWGSCSAKGNVNFNYLLAYLPEKLLDYVVIHELAHRKHMDHSKEFWEEVKRYCPDYKECRKQLREYRPGQED